MSAVTPDSRVMTEGRLREIVSAPKPDSLVMRKEVDQLDRHCRSFIAKSPFMLLSTSNATGQCDVSPRGDGPGFVSILDERTLAIPDRPGNRRLDSMLNILENPHAGLLFLIPGIDETLRVNGSAYITEDANLLESMKMKSKTSQLAIIVEAEEIFFHCARAFKRAKLWDPEVRIDRSELPTLGQIIADQVTDCELDSTELDESLEESNQRLY